MQQFLDQLQSVLELDYEDTDMRRLAMGLVLSLKKGAHAVLSMAAHRKFWVSRSSQNRELGHIQPKPRDPW
jgi:hypothetical protein